MLPVPRFSAALAAVTAAGVLCSAACGSSSHGDGGAGITGRVTVLAAASLQAAFGTIKDRFEAAHPGVTVRLSFGGSSALAQQINAGAAADVFASASPTNMRQVIAAGNATASTDFAANVMAIAVPPSNPAKVTELADLAKRGVKVALCQPQVPCGAVAAKVFAHAKITVRPVTLEQDVKSTLTKVITGEVGAGLVYVTDVRAAGSKVRGIAIPPALNASTAYPIAVLRQAPNASAARAFVAYVLSSAGQKVLSDDGFAKP